MKKELYKSLYNVASLDAFATVEGNIVFTDSQAGTILGRHLEAIDPTIFEKQYPELVALIAGFTIDNTGGVAEYITSLKVDATGEFKEAGDKSTNKGKVTLKGDQSQIPVYEFEATSDWSDNQVKRLDTQGVNLVNRLLQGHDQIYKRDIDTITLVGIADRASSVGILNNTNFTSEAAGGEVETLTAKQRYEAIADLINDQHSAVNNTMAYKANRVIMPSRVRNALNVQYSDTSDPISVYNLLRRTFPDVELLETFRADTTARGGDLATSATVAISTNEMVGKIRIPEPLTVGEIYRLGSFHHAVDSRYRVAGYDLLEGLGGRRLTGL